MFGHLKHIYYLQARALRSKGLTLKNKLLFESKEIENQKRGTNLEYAKNGRSTSEEHGGQNSSLRWSAVVDTVAGAFLVFL